MKPYVLPNERHIYFQFYLLHSHFHFYFQKKGRVYMMGSKKFEIPYRVIEVMNDWNIRPEKATYEFDKKFVAALLLMCVSSDDLAKHAVNQEKKDFIFGNFFKNTSN